MHSGQINLVGYILKISNTVSDSNKTEEIQYANEKLYREGKTIVGSNFCRKRFAWSNVKTLP
jgi:hypothetical protein